MKIEQVFFLFLISCVGCQKDLTLEDSLVSEIENYYRHERNEEWSEIYECRNRAFKDTVPFSVFRKYMDDDATSFRNETAQILGMKSNGDTYHVTVAFVDRVLDPKVVDAVGGGKPVIRVEEVTTWKFTKANGLTCVNPGGRGHLAINSLLADED